MTTIITHRGRRIKATYAGGPYIELAFGHYTQPTEAINVWDDEAGEPEGEFARYDDMEFGNSRNTVIKAAIRGAIKTEIVEWIVTNEEEGWESWYEDYLENAKYA